MEGEPTKTQSFWFLKTGLCSIKTEIVVCFYKQIVLGRNPEDFFLFFAEIYVVLTNPKSLFFFFLFLSVFFSRFTITVCCGHHNYMQAGHFCFTLTFDSLLINKSRLFYEVI